MFDDMDVATRPGKKVPTRHGSRSSGPPAGIPVTIHAGRAQRGYLIDMNDRGVFAALPTGLPEDKLVEVEFEMPDGFQKLRVVGEVSWSNFYIGDDGVAFPGVGVEFLGVADEGLAILEQFVTANEGHADWQITPSVAAAE